MRGNRSGLGKWMAGASAAALAAVVWPGAARAATPAPALVVSSAYWMAGYPITIDTRSLTGMRCGNVVFGKGGSTTAAVTVSPGSPGVYEALIPTYITGAPGQAVTVGKYVLAVSCYAPGASGTNFKNFATNITVNSAAIPSTRFSTIVATPDGAGYWLARRDGAVFAFGSAHNYGSLASLHITPTFPVVGMAATADGHGYWLVGADGGIFNFGDAPYRGSLPGSHIIPGAPIVSIAAAAGGGYRIAGADGAAYAFGTTLTCSASSGPSIPDTTPPKGYASGPVPAIGVAAYPGGYEMADSSGNVGCVGLPNSEEPPYDTFKPANSVSAVTTSATTGGTWMVGLDGGIFAPPVKSGASTLSAGYYGSLPGIGVTPSAPIIGLAGTHDGKGYWLLGADGGVFNLGDAHFYGSEGGKASW